MQNWCSFITNIFDKRETDKLETKKKKKETKEKTVNVIN